MIFIIANPIPAYMFNCQLNSDKKQEHKTIELNFALIFVVWESK